MKSLIAGNLNREILSGYMIPKVFLIYLFKCFIKKFFFSNSLGPTSVAVGHGEDWQSMLGAEVPLLVNLYSALKSAGTG